MRFSEVTRAHVFFSMVGLLFPAIVSAQQAGNAGASQAESALAQSASQGTFTFIVFYKADDAATRSMAGAVEQGIAPRAGEAILAFVQITNPAEKDWLINSPSVVRRCLCASPWPLTVR